MRTAGAEAGRGRARGVGGVRIFRRLVLLFRRLGIRAVRRLGFGDWTGAIAMIGSFRFRKVRDGKSVFFLTVYARFFSHRCLGRRRRRRGLVGKVAGRRMRNASERNGGIHPLVC